MLGESEVLDITLTHVKTRWWFLTADCISPLEDALADHEWLESGCRDVWAQAGSRGRGTHQRRRHVRAWAAGDWGQVFVSRGHM